MYDYIIVGAGLSGTMLGYLLKKNGYNVIILEKQQLNKKVKLCGGIITPKTYNLLVEEFSRKDIDNIVDIEFKECNIMDKKTICLDNINIKIVDRKKLDDYILNEYLKIGGEVIENIKLNNIIFSKNTIVTGDKEYKFKYLIGADGTLSYVRKSLTGKIQNKNFALESFQKNNSKINFTIEFLDNYKGYNWIIPKQKEVCIGTGNVKGETKIEDVYNDLVERYNLKNEKRGAFLPTGNDILLNKKNIYLIGDAAGLISPITGEGIYYALYSAQALFKHFSKNYSYIAVMKNIIKKIKLERFLINIIYNNKIRNFVFNQMYKNNKLSKCINKYAKKILLN